jgi:hypothetical protein
LRRAQPLCTPTVLTTTTTALGRSCWKPVRDAPGRCVFRHGQGPDPAGPRRQRHAPRRHYLARTLFSVRTSRRLFRGMVHLTDGQSWQGVQSVPMQPVGSPDSDVSAHGRRVRVWWRHWDRPIPRRVDPSGTQALGLWAPACARVALGDGARGLRERLKKRLRRDTSVCSARSPYWRESRAQRPG